MGRKVAETNIEFLIKVLTPVVLVMVRLVLNPLWTGFFVRGGSFLLISPTRGSICVEECLRLWSDSVSFLMNKNSEVINY